MSKQVGIVSEFCSIILFSLNQVPSSCSLYFTLILYSIFIKNGLYGIYFLGFRHYFIWLGILIMSEANSWLLSKVLLFTVDKIAVFFEVKIHLKLLSSGIGMECQTKYRVKEMLP